MANKSKFYNWNYSILFFNFIIEIIQSVYIFASRCADADKVRNTNMDKVWNAKSLQTKRLATQMNPGKSRVRRVGRVRLRRRYFVCEGVASGFTLIKRNN